MRLIAGVIAVLLAFCVPGAALAHATLVSSDPGDGSVVTQAPKMVQLRFNEPVAPAAVNLIDAEGNAREVAMHAVDRSVLISLPESLPRGTQIVSYRVVSEDGHPVAGSITFSIGAASRASPGPSGADPVSILIWLARIGVYLGLFVGVGGVFFAAWIGQGTSGATVVLASLHVGLASAVIALGLQGVTLLGLPLSAMMSAAPWKSAIGTSLGPSLLLAIAAMLVARLAWRSPSMTIAGVLAGLSMAGVGLSLAVSGHAATASPQWLTRPSAFLHGVGVAYWVGALAPIATLARRKADTLPRVLKRFSAAAVPIVGILALSGLLLACVQLKTPSALIETGYGIILCVKLVLVALLLVLAALNRYWLTPALAADIMRTRPLLRSVLVECSLAVLILAAVAGWRFTPPPRALASMKEVPLSIHIHTDAAMFQVLIAPGKAGRNDFVLRLMNADASPLAAKEVVMRLSLPERRIEALERKAVLGKDGYWHVSDLPVPLPGRWHIQIGALVTDFQQVTVEDDFDLR
jgi:copper transport protein